MKILAIDHGTRKVGLAISDETGLVAARLPVLLVKNMDEACEGVQQICNDMAPEQILVGLPLRPDGSDTEQSEIVKIFIEKLKKYVDTQIVTANEAFTTQMAESGGLSRRQKQQSDSEAARLLLQDYLDEQSSRD